MVLPDRAATPGAVNPAVTQASIGSTICRSGYTATIRPGSSYTSGLKDRQLSDGYTFRGDTDPSAYEEDHLISLELGGSATSPENLWPEPYATTDGARVKDEIENKLHELICDGSLTLRTAQQAIASNWWAAYRKYLTAPAGPAAEAPAPTPTPPRTGGPSPPVQRSCTTSSSGTCIRGGGFCPKARYGMTGYDGGGRAYRCTGDSAHPHWE